MLPDKKSNSFTWLQGTKRHTSESTKTEKTALKDDTDLMDVDLIATPSSSTLDDFSKENKQTRRKRMTRMGASSLIRRTSSSGKSYLFMEQDLPEEDEEGEPNTSGGSRGSISSSSLTQKFNKTMKDVKTSIGNLSQRLRRSTRRRYAMCETTSMVDISPTRRILGRTPTKLYSPFGFDSPVTRQQMRTMDHHTPSTPNMTRKMSESGRLYSGPNKDKLVQTRMGLRDLKNTSEINCQNFNF